MKHPKAHIKHKQTDPESTQPPLFFGTLHATLLGREWLRSRSLAMIALSSLRCFTKFFLLPRGWKFSHKEPVDLCTTLTIYWELPWHIILQVVEIWIFGYEILEIFFLSKVSLLFLGRCALGHNPLSPLMWQAIDPC